MFFIHTMGRRSRQTSANTLEELGEAVTKAIKSETNDAVVVSVGLTDQAVMPYVWIRRNEDDKWEGELGDCIKLGIKDGSLIEKDPIEMLNLDQAVARGIARVYNDGVGEVIQINPPTPIPPKKQKKRSNEELIVEANKMVKNLFANIREEEDDEE